MRYIKIVFSLFLVLLLTLTNCFFIGIGSNMAYAEVENLLNNPGFETGNIDSWYIYPGSEGFFSVVDDVYHSGNYSLKVAGTRSWKPITQVVSVTPGTDYTFSFYGKCDTATVYKILKADATNGLIAESLTSNNNVWTKYTLNFNSGTESEIKIWLTDSGGIGYFDDFILQKTQYGVVQNPGFETGDMESWYIYPGSESIFSIVDGVYHSGNYSLKLNGSRTWKNFNQIVPVKQNTDYILIFYAKCDTATIYKVLSTDATPAVIAESKTANDNDWTRYSLSFNSGVRSKIRLAVIDSGGTNYFDDFYLRESTAPLASNVSISGTARVGLKLTGNYTFSDADADAEGLSTYRWLESSSVDGTYTPIEGAISKTLTLKSEYIGEYIKFEVTPVDDTGKAGTAVQSDPTSMVAQAEPRDLLSIAISNAVAYLDTVQIGNKPGEYPQSAKDAYLTVIADAQAVLNMTAPSQSEIDSAMAALEAAAVSFDSQRITIPSNIGNYISRIGDKLYDGQQEFRFISFNVPELSMNETPGWHIPDPWEQEDAVKSIQQIGGLVTRTYVLSVKKASDSQSIKRHVMAPGVFDEDVFKALDKVLQLCNEYNVRVIIPLVDQWSYWGGITEYAAFRGKSADAFWTDPQIRADFKLTIHYLLNRINTYTGVRYKDDKAVLAWETGNELFPTDEWTQDISAYIKSIDSKHLVLDGKFLGISEASLQNDNVDIVSDHYYIGNYPRRCDNDRNKSMGKKPFIVGEFGHAPTKDVENLLNSVIANGTSGAMIWSLKQHNINGGFYDQYEQFYYGIGYRAYHWPGFLYGDSFDERNVVALMRQKAYEIRGLSVPVMEAPAAPVLLDTDSILNINWRGSTGASSYDVERTEDPSSAEWVIIGRNVEDYVPVGSPVFADMSAVSGKSYYYRVKAKNSGGSSGYSNVIGPVSAQYKLVDTNSTKAYYAASGCVVYALPSRISSFYVETVMPSDSTADFSFYVSEDDADYQAVTVSKSVYSATAGNNKVTYTLAGMNGNGKYLKIVYPASGVNVIDKTVIEYVNDGSSLVLMKPLKTSGILVDYMNDFYGMFSHSGNLEIDTSDPSCYGNDACRIMATANTNEYIIYRSAADMNSFRLDTYFNAGTSGDPYRFYVSGDNITYSEYTPHVNNLGGNREKVVYEGYVLPSGTKYLKVAFPGLETGAQAGTMQIGINSNYIDFFRGSSENIIEDCEYYEGLNTRLQGVYTRSSSGNAVTVSLDGNNKNSGNYTLRYAYTIGTPNYAGVTRNLHGMNLSDCDMFQFWIKPDGSNRIATLQLHDGNGEYWEAYYTLNSTEAELVRIPFSSFSNKSWLGGCETMELKNMKGFSIYINQGDGAAGSGIIYFDDIKAFSFDKVAPVSTCTVEGTQKNGWYINPVTVYLSATDNQSNVSKTEYSLNSCAAWQLYTEPVTFDQDGKYVISYRSTDSAGNTEEAKTHSFDIDMAAPTIVVSGLEEGSSYSDSGDLSLQILVSDDLSGVDDSKTTVTLDGYGVQQGVAIPFYTLPLGLHTFTATSSDLAGNQSGVTITFRTVTSIGALKELVTCFAANNWIDNDGIANSLQAKLAQKNLKSFVNEVQAQSGKHISVEAAQYLLRDAVFLSEN